MRSETLISPYRRRARAILTKLMAEYAGQTPAEIDKAIQDAYPFGARKYYPYKVWCEEVQRIRAGNVSTRFPVLFYIDWKCAGCAAVGKLPITKKTTSALIVRQMRDAHKASKPECCNPVLTWAAEGTYTATHPSEPGEGAEPTDAA